MKSIKKNFVKVSVVLLMVAAVLVFGSCSYEVRDDLVGQWASEGAHARITFYEDGTFWFRTGLIWGYDDYKGEWGASKNGLKFTYTDKNTEHSVIISYSINGSTLKISEADENELIKKINKFSPYYKEE